MACPRPEPDHPDALITQAGRRGVEPLQQFALNRRPRGWDVVLDLIRLRRFLSTEGIEVLHVHRSHDHIVGGLAAGLGRGRVPIVRTSHVGDPLDAHPGNRWLLRHATDALITLTEAARAGNVARFALDPQRVAVVPGAVDLARFDPGRVQRTLRADLGLRNGQVAFGIVARVQRHRRFDTLLRAFAQAVRQAPDIRLVIVGRGTYIREVAMEPAARLGLQDRVIFAGYHREDYLELLASVDVALLLVPGSDGSCRAVLEAMALEKPVIAARRGALPEIVEDGVSGMVLEDTPERLADAILRLAGDPGLRRRLGEAARARAVARFGLAAQAAAVEACYEQVISRR